MTITMVMATVAMMILAVPAMAYQPAGDLQIKDIQNSQFDKELINIETAVPLEEMGCPLIPADPVSPSSPNDKVVPGGAGDNGLPPVDIPEVSPKNPTKVPPPEVPPPEVTPPVTPPSSKLPNTGTQLALLAGIGILVAIAAIGARLTIARRMK